MNGTLMRSRFDRKIAGVCGGIARNQDWDSTLVRLIWLALVLFAGTGVLAYIVLWIVLPEEPIALPPYAGYAPPTNYSGAYGQPPYPQHGSTPSQPYPSGQTYQGPGAPHDPSRQG